MSFAYIVLRFSTFSCIWDEASLDTRASPATMKLHNRNLAFFPLLVPLDTGLLPLYPRVAFVSCLAFVIASRGLSS